MSLSIPTEKNSAFYLESFSEIASYTEKTVSSIAKSILSDPILIGIHAAVKAFPYYVGIAVVLEISGLGDIGVNMEMSDAYEEAVFLNPFNAIVQAPVFEELVFRETIQTTFMVLAEQILPDSDIEVFSTQIKLSALVSIVATSILFGLAHLQNGTGLVQCVLATLSGLLLGYLKHEYGLSSSIAAHMTNNTIAWSIAQLSSSSK